ncbi:HlyD family secretion protein [Mixta hanseatica]|uniref:HlyD family efflux transporter periplasmic adaptor subunit n=1 Tax=Mixta hanseatica TaxID=2872648 RepID=A0ABY4R7W8_9GAMM|nr:HlyD family efflux transporter periplasmic adaptor subunit [Mixta hanseatica]UQY44488.1 HlyD family efflux transporter periplasmic adaptor subunit [Mixta hanseatica]
MDHYKGWLLPAILLLPVGCKPLEENSLHGYIEAHYLYISPATSGTLKTLAVNKGEQAEKAALLFTVDNEKEQQEVNLALAQLAREQLVLKDLSSGKRQEELAILHAQRRQASEALALAESKLVRERKKYQRQMLSEFDYEQVKRERQQKASAVDEINQRITAESLPARTAQYAAQQHLIKAAQATLAKAAWANQQTSRYAPVNAQVSDIYYSPGEWVPAGKAVLALLPPENIKVRFFVSALRMSQLRYAQTISIRPLSGPPLLAQINYISPQAEYTPPLVYSNQQREQMVFLIEAVPQNLQQASTQLHPGMAVTVML